MRLCTTHPAVRRTWTVEVRPERGGPSLYCPQCPSVRVAAPEVLAHLAQHACRDALAAHLRTCQCHARGCRWHRRHRGCSGPVLLVLTRELGGRLWRLADACAACAGATAHAAVVPDAALAPPTARARNRSRAGGERSLRGPSEQLRVREMLNYLGVALPAGASAPARLLALQCALRSTAAGHVSIPAGLIRGMRLGPGGTPHQELEDAGWLHFLTPPPSIERPALAAQLLDATVRSQAPGRRERARAADWALRVYGAPQLSPLGVAQRLLGLAVASHSSGKSGKKRVDEDLLARMCGIALTDQGPGLDLLVAARFIRSWAHDPHSGELEWESRSA